MSSAREQEIGRTVRRLRRAVDLSQAALADALTSHGVPFSQQTVLKVEKGTRPLKLVEAQAIADVVGGTIDDLLDGDNESAAREALHAAEAKVAAISRELHE